MRGSRWTLASGMRASLGCVQSILSMRRRCCVDHNTDRVDHASSHHGRITSIPTLMIIRDNVVLYARPGALPEQALDDLIEQARAVDMEEVRQQVAVQSS
jgi:hypothetical protein